jgi:cytochrome P450
MASRQAGTCPITPAERELLATASLTDPAIRDHPDAFYAAMRRHEPVFYDEKAGMWLVTRFDDAQTVLRDSETYSAERGYNSQFAKGFIDEFSAILKAEGGGFFPDVIKSDPPRHTRIRRLMDNAFTAHRVKQLEPNIARIAVDLVEKMIAKAEAGEEVDGVADFATPMTIHVICEQLGIFDVEAETIKRWSHALIQQIGMVQTREEMIDHARQVAECQNYLIAQIRDRQANPREDMISDLVHARAEGDADPTLNFEETVSLVRALLIAGNETTSTGMGHLVFILATQPETARRLHESIDDDRLLTRFVEEMLRMDPPIRVTSRMTTREVELGGRIIPEGAHLLLVYGSLNFDESQFACPHAFDLDRPNLTRQLAFGAGVHRCIGAALARMELKVAAREIVRRLDDIKLMIPAEQLRYVPSMATHRIAYMPISFTRRK